MNQSNNEIVEVIAKVVKFKEDSSKAKISKKYKVSAFAPNETILITNLSL